MMVDFEELLLDVDVCLLSVHEALLKQESVSAAFYWNSFKHSHSFTPCFHWFEENCV